MKRLSRFSVLAVLVTVLILAGSLNGFASPQREKQVVIGLAWDYSQNIARIAEEDLVRNAAEKRGMRVIFTQADQDSTKQHANIEDLVSAKVNAIIAIPQDSKAISSGIKLARDAGIPFICIDRTTSPDAKYQPDAFASTDSVKQAYSAGIALADILDKDGVKAKVLDLIGNLTDENAINRDNGFKTACKERGMEIVAEVPTEWNPEKALNGTTNAFTAHPEINTIFIASDYLLAAVQSVLQARGKWIPHGQEGHIYIASQDVFPSGYKAVMQGYMDSDTAWDIGQFAEKGVDLAARLIRGEKLASPLNLVEGRVVTKANVDTIQNLWGKMYSE